MFSSELSSSETSGHSIYNPSKSSTAKQLSGETWNISYGDGSGASGNVYTDDVTVGGVTVTGQAVELAEQISSQFQQDTDSDGLLGLAFSSINTGSLREQSFLSYVLKIMQFRPTRRRLSSTPPSTKACSHRMFSPQISRKESRAHTTSDLSTPASTPDQSRTSTSTTRTASGNSPEPATRSDQAASNPAILTPSPTPAPPSSSWTMT